MSTEGYIKSYRPKKDDPLYFKEPFTKWQAWHDLIFLALWKDTQLVVRSIVVNGKRGCVYVSQTALAERWKWDKKKVIRFLKMLEKLDRVTLQKSNVINSISINNYERYQSNDTPNDTPNDPHKKNIRKIKKDKESISDFSNEKSSSSAKADDVPQKLPKKPKKAPALVTKARKVFETYFTELYSDSYYWQAKDAVAMKRLLQKIKFSRENRAAPLPTDDDSLVSALLAFLKSINKDWIVNNFSVTKIDSQYNEIISQIKNRKNNDNRQETSDKRRGYDARTHSAEEYEKDF